jgi:hypothetical protein
MQLLTAKFNQIASAIDATNAQIIALQAKLSELQEHQQQLLSVEQACQSALSQVDTALMMLQHVDPSQVEVFRAAIEVNSIPTLAPCSLNHQSRQLNQSPRNQPHPPRRKQRPSLRLSLLLMSRLQKPRKHPPQTRRSSLQQRHQQQQ